LLVLAVKDRIFTYAGKASSLSDTVAIIKVGNQEMPTFVCKISNKLCIMLCGRPQPPSLKKQQVHNVFCVSVGCHLKIKCA